MFWSLRTLVWMEIESLIELMNKAQGQILTGVIAFSILLQRMHFVLKSQQIYYYSTMSLTPNKWNQMRPV